MIIIVPLDGRPIEHFKNYNDLFECITTTEHMKRVAKKPDFQPMNWSFTIHAPKHVSALYAHTQNPSAALREAFEEQLSLIEICIGDSTKPQHIVLTPNVNMDYLKKKWCVDWCTWHHLLVREGWGGIYQSLNTRYR